MSPPKTVSSRLYLFPCPCPHHPHHSPAPGTVSACLSPPSAPQREDPSVSTSTSTRCSTLSRLSRSSRDLWQLGKISLLNVSSMDPNSTTPSASHDSSSSSSKQLSHASRRLHCPAISDQIVFVCRNKPHFCYSPALPPPTEFVRRRGIGSPGQYICTAVNITVLLLSVAPSWEYSADPPCRHGRAGC